MQKYQIYWYVHKGTIHHHPWNRQHCRQCKASASLMEKPHRAPPKQLLLEPVHSKTRGCWPQSGCWPPKWLHTTLSWEQSVAHFHSPGIVHDLTAAAQHCQSCIRTISAALKLSNVSPKCPTSEVTFFLLETSLSLKFSSWPFCKGNWFCSSPTKQELICSLNHH